MLISEIFKNKLCPKCNKCIDLYLKCIYLHLQKEEDDCSCLSNYYAISYNILYFLRSNLDYKIINDNSFFLQYKNLKIEIPDQNIEDIPNIINKLEENIAFY